jgi:serine/threonine protein phosphatase PrpC
MGGHAAGDVASQSTAALATVTTAFVLAEMVDQVEDVPVRSIINCAITPGSLPRPHGRQYGVTLLAADAVGVTLWAGDSRLKRMRDGTLAQITRDHNPIGELLTMASSRNKLPGEGDEHRHASGGHYHKCFDVAVFDIRRGDTFRYAAMVLP